MNFSPFGGHFSTTIPTIHQFAAKFTHENTNNVLCPSQETNTNRYTANGVPSFTQHHPATPSQQHMVNNKYQTPTSAAAAAASYLNQGGVYGHQNVRQTDKRYEHQELAQELCAAMQQNQQTSQQQQQSQDKQNNDKVKQEREQEERNRGQQPNHHPPQQQQQQQQPPPPQQNQQLLANAGPMPPTWQSLAAPGSTVADYLSHLPASTLPLSLHHFLKYSAETIKKETTGQQQQLSIPTSNDGNLNLLQHAANGNGIGGNPLALNGINAGAGNNLLGANTLNSLTTINAAQIHTGGVGVGTGKKKKKKKAEKEKKPRPKPGEIRLTTALDGSTLYCCPECHMAYPEKELLEQHLVGHTLERRFVCDICGAGLKRKDHLTRHKQSHNPERPYVCTVCLKAFKRKEQLTLHFVIHSGEKRHICTECGKGFYRKDHLRKHTRSHIARRVKAELSQQGTSAAPTLQLQVAAPVPTTTSSGILS